MAFQVMKLPQKEKIVEFWFMFRKLLAPKGTGQREALSKVLLLSVALPMKQISLAQLLT